MSCMNMDQLELGKLTSYCEWMWGLRTVRAQTGLTWLKRYICNRKEPWGRRIVWLFFTSFGLLYTGIIIYKNVSLYQGKFFLRKKIKVFNLKKIFNFSRSFLSSLSLNGDGIQRSLTECRISACHTVPKFNAFEN